MLGLVGLQTADLSCTYLLLDGGARGDVYEANPLARRLLDAGGWGAVAAFKVGLTAVAVAAAWAVSRSKPAAAARLLGGLCVLMLAVNVYSIWLLATPDAAALAERDARRRGESLAHRAETTRLFVAARNELLDDVLDDECDTAEASRRMAELIRTHGPAMRLPAVVRLPEPGRHPEVMAYLRHHLRDRAEERGMGERFAAVPKPAFDPLTPPWAIPQ